MCGRRSCNSLCIRSQYLICVGSVSATMQEQQLSRNSEKTKQVNYLIDKGMTTNEGSNAVISYIHHFFSYYGLGETSADLHCDNCSSQNKNKFLVWYFLWWTIHTLHHHVSVNFLIAGHTKFGTDWCFGLVKQKCH